MSEFKELRSIELSSFTTMTTGIAVLFSIISAIIISVGIFAFVPNGGSIVSYLIPTIIVGSFMFNIYNSFSQGLLYNLLAKKLKTIVFEINEGKEIVKVSTSETATMIALILTIQVILLYLVSMLILPLLLTTAVQTLMYSGQQAIAYSFYQALIVLSQPATIAIFIFGTFIITFVFVLLGTYIYNILAKNGRGIVLNLSNDNGFTSINSINPMKLAIVFAIIIGILNLIIAIITLINGGAISSVIGNVLGGFIGGFVEFYLFAIFYNYLASKIDKIKIELIDFKIN